MPRTDGFDAAMAVAGCQITTLLEENLLNLADFHMFVDKISGGEFTRSELRKQIEDAICVPGFDDTIFSMAFHMSQCDMCGAVGVGFPKMLTCGNCRGYYYCQRECQKKHWKLCHKHMCTKDIIRREHFQTTGACVKILSVLCMDWPTKTMNAEDNHIWQRIKQTRCKDCIYVPVYDKKRLSYIPMPNKILSWLESISNTEGAAKSRIEQAHVKFKESDCVVLIVPTKVQGCSIMTKETFVSLPWAAK